MVESPTHWLADEAVYRRTQAGTGHTPLRVLLDMGGDDPDIGATIRDLSSRGLIKLEEY